MNSSSALPMTSWSLMRQSAAALLVLICMVGLGCAALYVSAVLFLLLNKADPRQARLASMVDYWAWYAGTPKQRQKLVGSITASGLALFSRGQPRLCREYS